MHSFIPVDHIKSNYVLFSVLFDSPASAVISTDDHHTSTEY